MSGAALTRLAVPRLVFVAENIAPDDARYIKLRGSFAAAGFEIAAVAPLRAGRKLHGSVTGVPIRTAPSMVGALWPRAGAALSARNLSADLAAAGARHAPDVIYVFDPEALPAAVALKRLTAARLIYDAHEFHRDEHADAPARGAWVGRAEQAAAAHVDVFVTVNRSIARIYAEVQPELGAPLVVHNAVDPTPLVPDDGRLRAAAALPGDARILLYQGGLSPGRGLERLVMAAEFLAPSWTLVLMGRGVLETSLRSLADSARVRFIPAAPHAELARWTAGSTMGAVLYEDTGLNQRFCSPNKLWEYAASAVPALASDLPEIARVVAGHGTGILMAPDALPAAIAAAVNASQPLQLAALGKAARRFAEAETWSGQVAPLVAAARRLALGETSARD